VDRGEELALLPLADERAAQLLASVPGSKRTECWWLVLRDGTLVRGDHGGGVLLLAELRATRRLGHAVRRLGMSPVIDGLDKVLARCRKYLGRFVPEGPAPVRYP
jgi:hypothetical protein